MRFSWTFSKVFIWYLYVSIHVLALLDTMSSIGPEAYWSRKVSNNRITIQTNQTANTIGQFVGDYFRCFFLPIDEVDVYKSNQWRRKGVFTNIFCTSNSDFLNLTYSDHSQLFPKQALLTNVILFKSTNKILKCRVPEMRRFCGIPAWGSKAEPTHVRIAIQ